MTGTSIVEIVRGADRYDVAAGTFGLLLGGAALALVELDRNNVHAGVGAAIGVLFMTVPIAIARRRPVAVAGFIAVAALANGVFLGHVTRCGVALPAAWFVSYTVGSKAAGRRSWLGLALCLAGVGAQLPYDPRLGWSAAPFLIPLTLVFYGCGRLVRSRAGMVTSLRERNEELRQHQARTAAMAVAADRAQLAGALDTGITANLGTLADAAVAGRDAVGTDAAVDALAAIEITGRSTLNQMREVVGTLRDESVTQPLPSLAALSALARRRTGAAVSVTIDGDPESVPPVVEVSAYRVVEHLLEILVDSPDARIVVSLVINPAGVSVTVDGPVAVGVDQAEALAKVRARVALHEGRLEVTTVDGSCHVVAQIPVAAGVA